MTPMIVPALSRCPGPRAVWHPPGPVKPGACGWPIVISSFGGVKERRSPSSPHRFGVVIEVGLIAHANGAGKVEADSHTPACVPQCSYPHPVGCQNDLASGTPPRKRISPEQVTEPARLRRQVNRPWRLVGAQPLEKP